MVGRDNTHSKLNDISLQHLVNSLDTLYYFIGVDGTLQKWNDKVVEVTGYSDEELAGRECVDFFAETDRGRVSEALNKIVSEQCNISIEADLITKDGSVIPYAFSGNPIVTDDGEVIGISGTGRDLSEQKQQEQKLRQFGKVVEQTGHVVYITDPDGTIEYANTAFENITGYSTSDAIGETPAILHAEGPDERYEEAWETVKSGASWDGEMVYYDDSGEELILSHTITPLTDEDGNIENVVAVAQDITELKTYERTLQRQRDDLEILNKIVRHDVRNDLELVLGYADMVRAEIETDEEEHIDKVLAAARDAVDITTSAREITEVLLHPDSDVTALPIRSVVMKQLDEIRSNSDHAIITTSGDIPDVKVAVDGMVHAIFRNLLKNALLHNDKQTPEITVSASTTKETVRIHIADNGPGIPETHRDQIFEEGTTGLDNESTGLGLYLVDTLVDRYDGNVWIEDNDPQGVVFTVELPRAGPSSRDSSRHLQR